MNKLILKFKDRVIEEFPLTNNTIKIGRDEDNDIAIDNSAISRHHAKIEPADGQYMLSDLNSTNGTFINQKRIKEQVKLKNGDLIIVGKHDILIELDYVEVTKPNISDFEGTMALNTEQQRELLSQQKSSDSKYSEKNARLIVTQSGEQKEHLLAKNTTVIGKSPMSDIVLKGFMVPPMAATIRKEGDSYYISGYGGWIKVTVNGRIAGRNWKLYPNDIIEVRNVKIIFKKE